VRRGSNHCSNEEERDENKCEENHRAKENNTNFKNGCFAPSGRDEVPLRRSVDKWAFNERIGC
jgi:hypothetical protein